MRTRWLAAAAAGAALLLSTPGAHAAARTTSRATTLHGAGAQAAAPAATPAGSITDTGILAGDVEALGVRVEYDIPLPAGTGTVPHVVGDLARHAGNDEAHGIAGAPTQLDAVVGGQYVDPNGSGGGHPQRNLPQTECFFPGQNTTTLFRFPTDTQAQTAGAPATSIATAQCSAGPYVEMHATDAGIGTPHGPSAALASVVHSGASTADGIARTVHGVFESDASAHVSDLNILGVIDIGSVSVSSHSETTGVPGHNKTIGTVTLSGATAAGTPFSVSNNDITVAGQSAPIGSTQGAALQDQLNNSLTATGCKATAVGNTTDYPQGFILARKPPVVGVAADGSSASSMEGGMLFVCDVPKSLTANLGGFSPQRMQILAGFAFTGVSATTDPGGFNLGDLGGSANSLVTTTGSPRTETITTPGALGQSTLPVAPPVTAAPAPVTNSPAAVAGPSRQLAAPVLTVGHYKLDPTDRAVLFAVCLLGWLGLTALGIRQMRGVTAG